MRALAALFVIAGFGADGAAAQTYESQESLVSRIEALSPLVEAARIESEAAVNERRERNRLAAEAAAELDTIMVGYMTIITPLEDVAEARERFGAVWSKSYEGIVSESLQHWTFLYQSGREHVPIHFADSEPGPLSGHQAINVHWWQSREDADAVLGNSISAAINRDIVGSAMSKWSSSDPLADYDPADLYRTLATVASRSVQSCYAGDASACALSLGLDEKAGLDAWYSSEERRALVLRDGPRGATPAARRELSSRYAACAEDGDNAQCEFLLAMQGSRDFAPLIGPMRASLLGMALDRGGEGAWTRLVEAKDWPIADALAHTSGVEPDRLVADWRAWVMEGRPEVHASLPINGGIATLWIIFFAGLAMRSTRWRLG